MENFVKLIDAIAWPIAIVWLGHFFKGEVRILLSRISYFKYKDAEAKFDKELSIAENAAKNLSKSIPKQLSEEDEPHDNYTQLVRISEVSPRAAIMEAWIQIETALARVSGDERQPIIGSRMGISFLKDLVVSNKLSEDSIDVFNRLRKLRNEAAHLPDFAISQSEAERYLEMSAQISHAIQYYGKSAPYHKIGDRP